MLNCCCKLYVQIKIILKTIHFEDINKIIVLINIIIYKYRFEFSVKSSDRSDYFFQFEINLFEIKE